MMTEKIKVSSDLTFIIKTIGLFTYILLIAIIGYNAFCSFEIGFFLFLFFCLFIFILTFRLIWFSAEVQIEDEYLYIIQTFNSGKIKFNEIENIEYARFTPMIHNEQTIVIKFKSKTIFGRKILLIPKYRGYVITDKKSVLEIIKDKTNRQEKSG